MRGDTHTQSVCEPHIHPSLKGEDLGRNGGTTREWEQYMETNKV